MTEAEFGNSLRATRRTLVAEKEGAKSSASTAIGEIATKGPLGKSGLNPQASGRGEVLSGSPSSLEMRTLGVSGVSSQLPTQGEKPPGPTTTGQNRRKRPLEESNVNTTGPDKRFIPPTIAPGERVTCHPQPK